jgi:putative FmdB family regulatory protein
VPLYEYRCTKCGHQFEKIQTFSAPDVKECPVCQSPVERLISAPAVHFSGSGFYATDYNKSKSAAPAASGSAPAATPSSTDSGSSGASTPAPTAAPASDSSSSSSSKSSEGKS